jgi:membrane protease YdiL (CAAX protease family)
VILGVAGMLLAGGAAQLAALRGHPLGLRPTLMLAESMLIAPAILFLRLQRRPVAASLGLHRIDRVLVLVALFGGAALWAASLGLLDLQSWIWPPSDAFLESFRQLHAALRPSNAMDAVLSVVAIAVVPAVCEEILFRGVVLPSLVPWLGRIGAVIGSALLFGLIHLDGSGEFTRIPFAIAVGVGLGLLRIRTRSLVPSIVTHATLNTITFATVLAMGFDMDETPDPVLGLALLAGGTMLSALVLRHARPPLTGPEADPRLVR